METQLKESLDALQNIFNDVLIQTGKALRAQHREASGQVVGQLQLKFPETRSLFSQTLDNLEAEIVQAKSVFQRDITRLQTGSTQTMTQQEQKQQPEPEPVEPQTKSPLPIEVESSPPAVKHEAETFDQHTDNKTVAPFPDMGMDSIDLEPTMEESKGDQKQPHESQVNLEAPPVALMSAGTQPEQTTPSQAEGQAKKNGESTAEEPTVTDSAAFTNMEFTLVPTDSGPQGSNNEHNQGGDGNAGQNALDGVNFVDFMPPNEATNHNNQPSFDMSTVTQGTNQQTNITDASALDDFDFSTNTNAPDMTWDGDGLDFDFNTDDNSFNDLMDSHEANYDGGESNNHNGDGQNDTFNANFLDMDASNDS